MAQKHRVGCCWGACHLSGCLLPAPVTSTATARLILFGRIAHRECGARGCWISIILGWASLETWSTDWQVGGTGDLNDDGKVDILWRNTATNEYRVWLMHGSTRAQTVSLGAVTLDWTLAGAADLNGDGVADILWENTVIGVWGVWLKDGTTSAGWSGLSTEPVAWHIANSARSRSPDHSVCPRLPLLGSLAVYEDSGPVPIGAHGDHRPDVES